MEMDLTNGFSNCVSKNIIKNNYKLIGNTN